MAGYNPVHWFEIYVDDINRARKFYETVLGYTMNDMATPGDMDMKMIGFPGVEDGMGSSGALVQMEHVKAGGNSTLVYFGCQDCSVEQGRVEAAGGKVQQPKFSIGEYGFCAICSDTEGNYFGLYSMA